MDTPERNQIRAPVSKVEGSPVFNFINNLSPIKPVKPLHITQTFNTFSFASLPSVFTSPHITSQKESRILSRYNCSYPSKLELDSEDGIPTNEGIVMDNSVETRDSEVKTGMTFSCKSVFNLHHGIRRRCLDFDVVGAGRENLEDGSNSSASSLTQGDENIFSSDGQQCIIPEIGVQLLQDASQAPGLLANEELNQNSPKKKRRRMENEGETEGCKRCNCKKSKCLKLYCECFAAGVHCVDPCSCQECFNKPIHEDTILATRKRIESRNPLAFAPKVIRSLDSIPVNGDEPNKSPASARHKIGCNCKKSNCLKKYCECYQGGVGCSVGCRCEGCKNAFGTKDVKRVLKVQGQSTPTFVVLDRKINGNDLQAFYSVFSSLIKAVDSNKDDLVENTSFKRVFEGLKKSSNDRGVMEDVHRVMDEDSDEKLSLSNLKSYMNWAGFASNDDGCFGRR